MLQLSSPSDGLLFLQLRKLVGLLVAIARGAVPESYLDAARDANTVVPVPAAPAHLFYFAGCQYAQAPRVVSNSALDRCPYTLSAHNGRE